MQINPAHYDGQMHRVPFTIGADFLAKREAYMADGFMVAIQEASRELLVYKVMPGEPRPAMVA